jgi:hypothetical protein
MAATVERPPTPEQDAAIGAGGLVFVSAGAGTGKTSVLVERFARAVDAGVDVASILVITYTDRAGPPRPGPIPKTHPQPGPPATSPAPATASMTTKPTICTPERPR